MNYVSLKELGWFSFFEKTSRPKKLSIDQAVAYVLYKESESIELANEFIDELNQLEVDSAREIFDHYGESVSHYSNDSDQTDIDLQEVCIPESEVESDLNLLNKNRLALIEHFGGPVIVVFAVLQKEIDRKNSNPNFDQLYSLSSILIVLSTSNP